MPSLDMLTIIFFAILPAFALVVYIWLRDKYQREPLSQIIKAVAYGILSVVIALVLEIIIPEMGLIKAYPSSWLDAFWNAFVGAAIPEEAAKLLMLWLLLRRNPHFDERFDGIVYACCVGMGFAGTENIVYLFDNINCWETVAIQRAIFAVPGHFLFAVAMGFFYSRVHFHDLHSSARLQIIAVPIILHGIYDGLLFMTEVTPELSRLILIVFYIFCLLLFRFGRKKIRQQSQASDPNNIIFRV